MDENIKIGQDVPKSKIQALHTYQGDMARAIRDNNGSLVKISLAEQKRRENQNQKNKNSKIRSRNFTYFIISIILIAVVFMSVRFVSNLIKERGVNENIADRQETFFTIENQTNVSAEFLVGKESSAKAIIATLKEKSVPGEMNAIFFKKNTENKNISSFLSTQEFITRLQLSIPGSLVRSLDEKMLIGGYTKKDETEAKMFLVFRTNNYDQSFSGMLDWEDGLFSDLYLFFEKTITNENSYLLKKEWEDVLIDNNDARVLVNEIRQPVLYYIFLDRNTFMISDNLEVIQESSKRLRTEKLKISR